MISRGFDLQRVTDRILGAAHHPVVPFWTEWSSQPLANEGDFHRIVLEHLLQRKGGNAGENTSIPPPLLDKSQNSLAAKRANEQFRSSDTGFGKLDELTEFGRISHGQIREHLAIDLDRSFPEAVYEAAVRKVLVDLSNCGVDPHDPQASHVAFLLLAIFIGVLQLSHHLFGRKPNTALLPGRESLGQFQNLLVAAFRMRSSNDPHDDFSSPGARG